MRPGETHGLIFTNPTPNGALPNKILKSPVGVKEIINVEFRNDPKRELLGNLLVTW